MSEMVLERRLLLSTTGALLVRPCQGLLVTVLRALVRPVTGLTSGAWGADTC